MKKKMSNENEWASFRNVRGRRSKIVETIELPETHVKCWVKKDEADYLQSPTQLLICNENEACYAQSLFLSGMYFLSRISCVNFLLNPGQLLCSEKKIF